MSKWPSQHWCFPTSHGVLWSPWRHKLMETKMQLVTPTSAVWQHGILLGNLEMSLLWEMLWIRKHHGNTKEKQPCVHVCSWTCAHMWVCVCIHVCTCDIRSHPPYVLRPSFSLGPGHRCLGKAGCPNKSQGSPCLCFPSTGIASMYHDVCLFT